MLEFKLGCYTGPVAPAPAPRRRPTPSPQPPRRRASFSTGAAAAARLASPRPLTPGLLPDTGRTPALLLGPRGDVPLRVLLSVAGRPLPRVLLPGPGPRPPTAAILPGPDAGGLPTHCCCQQ